MKEIPLTKGYVATVDDEDYARLSAHKWTAMVTGKHVKRVYAYRRAGWNNAARRWTQTIMMHREVIVVCDGMDADHINGDTLNNTKANLRSASRSQNLANNRRSVGESGYRGVMIDHRSKTTTYQVMFRSKFVGRFTDKTEAAKAYDTAAFAEFGEFAKLNFPMAEPQA